QLALHIYTHLPWFYQDFYCTHCERNFERQSQLENHLNLHGQFDTDYKLRLESKVDKLQVDYYKENIHHHNIAKIIEEKAPLLSNQRLRKLLRKSKMGKSSTRRPPTPLQDESDAAINALMEMQDTIKQSPPHIQQKAVPEEKLVVSSLPNPPQTTSSRKRKLESEESSQLAKRVSSLEERITHLSSKLVQVCEQQSTDLKAHIDVALQDYTSRVSNYNLELTKAIQHDIETLYQNILTKTSTGQQHNLDHAFIAFSRTLLEKK
ncbi:unnamed protein product, partial [Owenia fusiformis]